VPVWGAMRRGQFHVDPVTYLDAVRSEVHSYDEFQDAVADATTIRARVVLDLGIGTGETARRVMERHPKARWLLLMRAKTWWPWQLTCFRVLT
jgi:hypothetical protein